MKPIFITIGAQLPLMIIPDSQAHANGHPVLTYTYSIFKNINDIFGADTDENEVLPNKEKDPNYMGYITFEQPDKLFSYIADGHDDLSADEVEETIELISHYRNTPGMWVI